MPIADQMTPTVARAIAGHGSDADSCSPPLLDPRPRPGVFTDRFAATLHAVSIEPLKLPAISPSLSAFEEGFVRSLKE